MRNYALRLSFYIPHFLFLQQWFQKQYSSANDDNNYAVSCSQNFDEATATKFTL